MQVGIVFRIPIAVNIYSCILLKCLHDLIIPILTRQLTGTNVLTVSCACAYYSIYRTGFFYISLTLFNTWVSRVLHLV